MIPTYAEIICAAVMAIGMPNADFACKHMDALVEASEKYDIDPVVLTALIHTESRWTPRAKSRTGACGLTQVIPKFTRKFRAVGISVDHAKNNPIKNRIAEPDTAGAIRLFSLLVSPGKINKRI